MESESQIKKTILVFFIGVFFSCLIFTKLVIDTTLAPRMIFLSLFLLFFLIFFVKSKTIIHFDIISSFYLAYLLYNVASLCWTNNFALSIFEFSKIFLFFTIFIFSQNILQKNENYFYTIISKVTVIIFFFSLLPALEEIINIKNLSRQELYQISAISGHKNLYSSFVFLCITSSCLGYSHLTKKWKILVIISILCEISIILFLQTRTVYIALIISFFAFWLIYFFRYKFYLKKINFVFALIITLASLNFFFLIILPKISSHYLEKKPVEYNEKKITDLSTFTERILVWKKTNEIINEKIWTGVGLNNWQIFFPSSKLPDIYRVTDLNVTFQRPHNDFLWVLSESGILGFNIYYLFIISILFFLLYLANRNTSNIILFCSLLGYLFISFFDFPKERIEHGIIINILLGMSVFNLKNSNINFYKKTFTTSKNLLIVYGFILIFVISVSFLFFKGEYLTKKIYIEKINKNNKQILNLCNSAISFAYNLDPTSIPILWYRGNANANLGNYKEALNDFKLAFKQHPFNHYVMNDLASAYYLNNLIDSAKYYYRESSKINPRFDDPKLNLTSVYINEGNYDEAKKCNESIFHNSERRSYYQQLINDYNKHAINNTDLH